MDNNPSSLSAAVSSVVPLLLAACSYIFFIIASMSIARSRNTRLEELAEEGAFGAGTAQSILKRSDAYLLYTQVGRFLSSTAAGFCLAFLMRDLMHLYVSAGSGAQFSYGALLALVVFALFVIGTLIAVQVVKSLSLQFPERCLCTVALPLRFTYPFFGPVVFFLHTTVSKVLGRLDVRLSNEREMAMSADDLSEIVKMSSEVGTIEQSEKELIEGVVELSDRIVREVMTPRKDVVWVREDASIDEIVKVCREDGVSRVLVCGSDLDEVRGIFISKDLLRFVGHQVNSDAWKPYIRPAHFVPNTKAVDELLVELRETGIHLAIVLDEHGGVDGVVSLEDLVEEIVGEIFDEFDAPERDAASVIESDGALLLDGAVQISLLKEQYDIDLPEGDYDTVAGFVLAQLGRFPRPGESFGVDGCEFEILEVHQQRVARVALRRVSSTSKGQEPEEPLLTANGGGIAPRVINGNRNLRIPEAS
jgi:putative hemolysin